MAWGMGEGSKVWRGNCQAGNNGVTGIRKDEFDVADREGLGIGFSFGCLGKQKFLIAFGYFH